VSYNTISQPGEPEQHSRCAAVLHPEQLCEQRFRWVSKGFPCQQGHRIQPECSRQPIPRGKQWYSGHRQREQLQLGRRHQGAGDEEGLRPGSQPCEIAALRSRQNLQLPFPPRRMITRRAAGVPSPSGTERPDDFLAQYGKSLREARVQLGLTQVEVAEMTGLQQSYIPRSKPVRKTSASGP
jgi:hypothetical protein